MDLTNIDLVETVAQGLGPLVKEVVFVGGATTGLYVKDLSVKSIRATDDVDCIIEITSRGEYYKIADQLRSQGFKEVAEEKSPLCRWTFSGILVDVMPTDPKILGFSNKWYKDGIVHAKRIKLPKGTEIAILSLPYFIATKIEAFKGRGRGDYRGSSDIEDIITVVDGNSDILAQLANAPSKLREYLQSEFEIFLRNKDFTDSIVGHVSDRTLSIQRAKIVENRIRSLTVK